MRQTWRWFGPEAGISLSDMVQSGVQGVVSALHHVPTGSVWSHEAVAKRKAEILYHPDGRASGLTWDVVESLPVSEAIKTQTGDWRIHLQAYRASLEALAEAEVPVVCYNFMPVLDWTRTDLRWRLPHGGTAMRFDLVAFAAFDLHILVRPGAWEDYTPDVRAAAADLAGRMDEDGKAALVRNITAGLPGSAEHWSLDSLVAALAAYDAIDPEKLRRHHIDFLSEIVPTAERLGLRLCCHPDDPPFPLLGLPRVMSTADDYAAVLDRVNSPAVGMTFCTGSLGARPDNDCVAIAKRFAPRIYFAHLRNVSRDTETRPCSFFEDAHLEGQTDMVAVVEVLLREEARRRDEGHAAPEIPMRPDHGQELLGDIGKGGQPGYPLIGRMRGLAELRGVMAAVARQVA